MRMPNFEFLDWLQAEMTARGWKKADLARHSGISPAQITRIMKAEQNPGRDTMEAIARAFHIPPEKVLRKVGILPTRAKDNQLEMLAFIFETLGEFDKQEVIAFAEWKSKRRGEFEKDLSARLSGLNEIPPENKTERYRFLLNQLREIGVELTDIR